MEEFVAYIIKNLVSEPEAVSVKCCEGDERLSIEIRVASADVGKIIGRRGNTINALRTIVRTVATRLGRKVQIDLIQDEQEKTHTLEPQDEAEEVAEESFEEEAHEELEVAQTT